MLQRATSCIDRVKPQWAGRRGPPSVACHARQRRIMPLSLGKQNPVAQAEPHETNRSMINRRKTCGWRACPRAERTNAAPAVTSGSVTFPDLLRALRLRRLLMQRRIMIARSGTAESDLLRKWSALRASTIKPSYRFRDTFRCWTITYVQLSR